MTGSGGDDGEISACWSGGKGAAGSPGAGAAEGAVGPVSAMISTERGSTSSSCFRCDGTSISDASKQKCNVSERTKSQQSALVWRTRTIGL